MSLIEFKKYCAVMSFSDGEVEQQDEVMSLRSMARLVCRPQSLEEGDRRSRAAKEDEDKRVHKAVVLRVV